MKTIQDIKSTPANDTVIMIGRGPSVDNLNLDAINKQVKFDTCTITDAIKLLKNPTYSFNYHDQGLRRIYNYIDNPKHLIIPIKLIQDIEKKKWFTYLEKLSSMNNVYTFIGRNRKDINVFTKGLFDIEVKDKLWNRHGSVVGVVNFLCGCMHYKNILYIGFDGGTDYGKKVNSNRKDSKAEGAAKDYERSWDTIFEMIKHYDVNFQPLKKFIK